MDKSDFFLQKTNLSPPETAGGHQKAKQQSARKGKDEDLRNGTGKKKELVPKEGVEPSCHCWRQILSLVRLPFRHFGAVSVR